MKLAKYAEKAWKSEEDQLTICEAENQEEVAAPRDCSFYL